MREIWKVWKESYSKRYGNMIFEVSNYGRVKLNDKLYKCCINKSGYKILCRKYLHRIVAELFIPGWKKDYEIDHKDRNRLNNMVSNLLICHNRKENMNNPLTIQYCRQAHPVKSVLQYTKDNIFVAEYVSVREAEKETNIFSGSIVKCCQHKLKSAGGYIWKYKEE